MIKVLFVCHGNICRSPMGEFIFKDLVKKAGLEDQFEIASAAVSREEIGNPVYPPARRELARHGIACDGHRAKQFSVAHYNDFDLVIVMEDYNRRNLMRLIACDCENKVWKLLDFVEDTPHPRTGADISDPWYHGNFDKTYKEIEQGCKGLLNYLGY